MCVCVCVVCVYACVLCVLFVVVVVVGGGGGGGGGGVLFFRNADSQLCFSFFLSFKLYYIKAFF